MKKVFLCKISISSKFCTKPAFSLRKPSLRLERIVSRQAYRQLALWLNFAEEDADGGGDGRLGVFIGDQVGAEFGKGQQVVGAVGGQPDDGAFTGEQALHDGHLLLIEQGVDRNHENGTGLRGGLVELLVFGGRGLLAQNNGTGVRMALAQAGNEKILGIAFVLNLRPDVAMGVDDQQALLWLQAERKNLRAVSHQGNRALVDPVTQLPVRCAADPGEALPGALLLAPALQALFE